MSFASKVQDFMKSLAGAGDNGGGGKPEKDPGQEPDINLDNQETGGDPGEDGKDKEKTEKSLVDATEILGSLVSELQDMNKSIKAVIAGNADVGEAVVGVAEMVNRIANAPVPPKSAMAKGGLGSGGGAPGGGAFPKAEQPDIVPTEEEFERAQAVLIKSFRDGEITIEKSEMISSDLQKAMRIPGYKMNPENYNFLVRKLKTA
jgi:hypothetical protein